MTGQSQPLQPSVNGYSAGRGSCADRSRRKLSRELIRELSRDKAPPFLSAVLICSLLTGCAAFWPGSADDDQAEVTQPRAYDSFFEAELRGQDLPDDMFRLDDAITLYEQGLLLDTQGRTAEAADAFEEAGRLWPDGLGTWVALAETSNRLQDPERFDAAAFMVQRTWLHDSDQTYVQREVNRSLRDYLQRQRRGDVDAGTQEADRTLELAERLADYYDWRAARSGRYEPERLAYFDIDMREIPAVVLSGAGLVYTIAP